MIFQQSSEKLQIRENSFSPWPSNRKKLNVYKKDKVASEIGVPWAK